MVYIYNLTNFGNKYYRSEIDMTGQSISGQVRSGQDMMNIYNYTITEISMTGQKWIWQVRTDQVRSEMDMTGQNRSGQVRTCCIYTIQGISEIDMTPYRYGITDQKWVRQVRLTRPGQIRTMTIYDRSEMDTPGQID